MNDCSNDTTLNKLINLSKNDDRIKIVNNDKNHGLLYSRAMGILNSSGEYLLNIDPDDELANDDNLEYLYNLAKENHVEIITFGILNKKDNQIINKCSKITKVEEQPKIFNSIFQRTNILNDYLIWNKLIKRELFLKAYEVFKEEIYNGKWNYFEDDIWNIIVNRYAKSKMCTNKLIYIYNYNNDSLINNRFGLIEFENLLYIETLIYRHNMYKKLFKAKKDEKFLVAEYIFLLNRIIWEKKYLLLLNNTKINSIIIDNFNFFLSNYNCSEKQKRNIINLLESIKI